MKKSLLAVAALSTLSGVCHAQGHFTMYGSLDTGVDYSSNTNGIDFSSKNNNKAVKGHLLSLSGASGTWGIQGSEEFSNGAKAFFLLETRFNFSNGKFYEPFFNKGFFGLSSEQSGTLTFGRQNDVLHEFVAPFAASSQWSSAAAHPGDLDNLAGTWRADNILKYISADYSGFKFGGMLGVVGVPGNIKHEQMWSLGAGYKNGPVRLGATYLNVPVPYNTYNLNGKEISPIYKAYFGSKAMQVVSAGGSYTYGPATIGANYSTIKHVTPGFIDAVYKYPTNVTKKQWVDFNSGEINLQYRISPKILAGLSYDITHTSSIADDVSLNVVDKNKKEKEVKASKDSKDPKVSKDSKASKDSKVSKDSKASKDPKVSKDSKASKDSKVSKDSKASKDPKVSKDSKASKDSKVSRETQKMDLSGLFFRSDKDSKDNTAKGARYYQGTLGVDYLLSKRTDIYFVAVHQIATGKDSMGREAKAVINGLMPSDSSQQTFVRVGIRHRF